MVGLVASFSSSGLLETFKGLTLSQQLGISALLMASVAVIWHVLQTCFRPARRSSDPKSPLSPSKVAAEDYPELHITPGPHLEVVLDPPCGLHCSNPPEPYQFENDQCYGSYFFFHPPWAEDGGKPLPASSADGLDYGEYFEGKTRLWEMRIQLRLKRAKKATEDIYFGCELEAYVPLGAAARRTIQLAVAAIRQAVGGVYQSSGDDPETCTGELEKPCCVLPMWAFDQFIVTPAGEPPPVLTSPHFPEWGCKRKGRMADYAREMTDLSNTMVPGPTYTFGFWGNSRFLDAIDWKLRGIPVVTPMDLTPMVGKPPVYVVFYTLDRADQANGKPERHLSSRKRFYFRAAIWSSKKRPDRQRFEALTRASWEVTGIAEPEVKTRHRSRLKGLLQDSMACCTSRPGS